MGQDTPLTGVQVDMSKAIPVTAPSSQAAAVPLSGVQVDMSKAVPADAVQSAEATHQESARLSRQGKNIDMNAKPGFVDRFAQVTGTDKSAPQAPGGSPGSGQTGGTQWLGKGGVIDGTLDAIAETPANLGSFAYNLAFHPIDTLRAVTASKQTAEDLKSGNYSGAAGDFAGGLINSIMLADAGSNLKAGVKNLATKAGDAFPAAAEKITGLKTTAAKAARPPTGGVFQPALSKTTQEVVDHAVQEGIDMTPAQVTQSPVAKNIQGVGERSVVGGEKLTEDITKQRLNLFDKYHEFMQRTDPANKGESLEAAGEDLAQQIAAKKTLAHDAAKSGYHAITELKDVPVDVSDIQQKWIRARREMQTVLDNAPSTVGNQLKQVLQLGGQIGTEVSGDIPARMAQLSFDDAMQLRSFYREMGELENAELPTRIQGLFKELSKDVDTAMAKSAHGAGMEDLWRQANKGWIEYTEKYGEPDSPLNRGLRQRPDMAAKDIMTRKSPRDIETLLDEGVDLSGVKTRVLDDIARKSFKVDKDGLGGYSHAFLRTLFGVDSTNELYLKSELARRMGVEVNPSGTSNLTLTLDQLTGPRKLAFSYGGSKVSAPRDPRTVIRPTNTPTSAAQKMGGAAAATVKAVPGVAKTTTELSELKPTNERAEEIAAERRAQEQSATK